MTDSLSQEEKREIQLNELTVLDEFDRVCKKHGIDYFLTAGTLLGAVRHGGFIPWDDDVDVAMKRRDFDRFRKIAESELSAGYFYQDERVERDYCFFFAKIRKSGTRVFERILKDLDIDKGVYIDIFPLDKCPQNERRARRLFKVVEFLTLALLAKKRKDFTCGYTKKSARLFFGIAKALPSPLLKLVRRTYVRLCGGGRLCTVAGSHGYPRETYDRAWFSGSVDVTFEGRTFPAPVGWDALLSNMYGDYREYPDESERDGHFRKEQ